MGNHTAASRKETHQLAPVNVATTPRTNTSSSWYLTCSQYNTQYSCPLSSSVLSLLARSTDRNKVGGSERVGGVVSMGRSPCCDRAAVKRGPWSPEEDDALRAYIQRHGTGGSWISLPKKAGLRRCGKSCRLRWLNYLRPDIRHGGFTDEEDAIIISLYSTLGSKWSLIASHLERRTDNDVKNYWNTKLKKRLAASAAAASSIPSLSFLPLPAPAPEPVLEPVPTHPSLLPLGIPTVKTETYTCDDFLVSAELQDPFAGCADADGSTSASAASSASNWSADNGTADGGGIFPDFCMGSDLGGAAAVDQFLGGYYYPLDPSLSLV